MKVNFDAPDLELVNLHGEHVSLDSFLGKIALVNLWATWCPPCEAEMPILESYYQDYLGSGFIFIGVNDGEPRDMILSFINQFNLSFPVWLDEEFEFEKAFGTVSMPSSYVIDREGVVRLMWIGAIRRQELEEYVTPLIME